MKRAPSFCVALVAVLSLAAPSVRAQSTDGKAGPAAPTMTKPAIQPFSRDLAPELQNAVRPVTLPALDVAVLKAEDSAPTRIDLSPVAARAESSALSTATSRAGSVTGRTVF